MISVTRWVGRRTGFASGALMAFMLSSSLHAASNATEAAQRAIDNNPQVQALFHSFAAAGDERREAWGGYLPSIDANLRAGREYRERDNRGSFDTYTAEIQLTQMLYDGFFTRSEVRRLDKARLVRYYELLDGASEVALEAMRAYEDVVRQRALVELARDNYARHREVFDQIEERVASGVGRGVDLEQISGRLALAESNLLTEASNLHDVSARYLRVVGERPQEGLERTELRDDNIPGDIREVLQLAFEGNPGFHAAIENISSAQANVSTQRSAYHPRLDLQARQSTNRNAEPFLGTGDRDITGDRGVIELVLSYNLFRGGSDRAAVSRATNELFEAMDLRDQACIDLRQDAQVAYNERVRLLQQKEALNQHRLSVEKVRVAFKEQFDIGQRTLLDVLDTENEYFQASRAYINALHDQTIAEGRVLDAMGRLLPALNLSQDPELLPGMDEVGASQVVPDPETICPADEVYRTDLEELTAGLGEMRDREPDVSLASDALFRVNSAELLPAAREELDRLADQLQRMQTVERVLVVGHADSTGNDAINDPLSEARAQSVKDFLVARGVAADRIHTEGRGSRDPVASNDTPLGRSQNRRVDITIDGN